MNKQKQHYLVLYLWLFLSRVIWVIFRRWFFNISHSLITNKGGSENFANKELVVQFWRKSVFVYFHQNKKTGGYLGKNGCRVCADLKGWFFHHFKVSLRVVKNTLVTLRISFYYDLVSPMVTFAVKHTC